MASRAASKRKASRSFGLGTIIAVAGGFSVIAGAIGAWTNTYPTVEPWIPASSGYVRHYADTATIAKVRPIETKLDDYDAWRASQSLEMARVLQNQQQQYLFAAKKELEQSPGSQVLRDHVTQLEDQLRNTQERIKNYLAQPSGRREISR